MSETITPTSTPSRRPRVARIRRADRSGSTGSRAAVPAATLERSTPALAQTKPWAVSVISSSPRRRSTRTASDSTRSALAWGSSASIGTIRPSALETIFWVTTTTSPSAERRPAVGRRPEGLGQQLAQVVAGGDLAQAGHRDDRQARLLRQRHRAPPGPARRPARGYVITVGATTQRTPSSSTWRGQLGVRLVDHQRPHPRGVEPGHADHGRLVPELGEQAVGRSLQRGAGHDRGDGHHVVATGGQRVVHPGHGQQRTDRDERVRRADHHQVGGGDGLEHTGGRPGRVGSLEPDGPHRHRVAESDEVVLEGHLVAVAGGPAQGEPDPGADRVVGHGQEPDGDPRAAASSAVTSLRRRPLRQALGAVEVGGQVPVAQAEPGLPAQGLQSSMARPALAGQAPARSGGCPARPGCR